MGVLKAIPVVEGFITVKLPADDWIWLCELLANVRADIELDEMCQEDVEHVLRTLQYFEEGV